MKESRSMISYMKVFTYSLIVWSSQYARNSSNALCDLSCYKGNNRLLGEGSMYSLRGDFPMRPRNGGGYRDDELHNMSRRMNSAVNDAHFERRFQALSSEDNLQGGFKAMMHDDNIQKRFSAIMHEGDNGRGSGNSFENEFNTRGRSNYYQHYKKGSGLKKNVMGLLKYDKYSGRKGQSSRGARDFDRQAHRYQQDIEAHQTPYNFNTFDITLNTHMPLFDSNGPLEEHEIKHVVQKKRLNRSALESILESFIKFVKKSDAMYETELLGIMTGTTGAYDGQHLEQKKNKGLGGMLKDKLTIISPIISIAIFLVLFVVFDVLSGVVITSILLIATALYVWYKYNKCERINKMYGIYDEQKLMEHSAKRKMAALRNSRYIR
ncbi:Pv-fam-d protein [Plasmodium cynomolgi strain B]|uniref:Pv-fam-d protein n=1 Tax=Plasmodium cynomolgi (strain B) TaxID=1120755 RepID=K6VIX5_PLACD|nr:Pv-fam-d protein [Plasmodium cynomolgi strain B]GAB69342.1 Pv-fam-d protein [Plasmodium cynomolgi strain B]